MSYYTAEQFGVGDWGFFTPIGKVSTCHYESDAAKLALRTEILDRKEALDGKGLIADKLRAYFAQEAVV